MFFPFDFAVIFDCNTCNNFFFLNLRSIPFSSFTFVNSLIRKINCMLIRNCVTKFAVKHTNNTNICVIIDIFCHANKILFRIIQGKTNWKVYIVSVSTARRKVMKNKPIIIRNQTNKCSSKSNRIIC